MSFRTFTSGSKPALAVVRLGLMIAFLTTPTIRQALEIGRAHV